MNKPTAKVLTTHSERCKLLWSICVDYSVGNGSGEWQINSITLPDGTQVFSDDEDTVLDAFCRFTDNEGNLIKP